MPPRIANAGSGGILHVAPIGFKWTRIIGKIVLNNGINFSVTTFWVVVNGILIGCRMVDKYHLECSKLAVAALIFGCRTIAHPLLVFTNAIGDCCAELQGRMSLAELFLEHALDRPMSWLDNCARWLGALAYESPGLFALSQRIEDSLSWRERKRCRRRCAKTWYYICCGFVKQKHSARK